MSLGDGVGSSFSYSDDGVSSFELSLTIWRWQFLRPCFLGVRASRPAIVFASRVTASCSVLIFSHTSFTSLIASAFSLFWVMNSSSAAAPASLISAAALAEAYVLD